MSDVNCLRIQPDGSNLSEVAELLRDDALLRELAERAMESFLLRSDLSVETLVSQVVDIILGSPHQRSEASNSNWEALVRRYEAFKSRREIVVATKERTREVLHKTLPAGALRALRSLYHATGPK